MPHKVAFIQSGGTVNCVAVTPGYDNDHELAIGYYNNYGGTNTTNGSYSMSNNSVLNATRLYVGCGVPSASGATATRSYGTFTLQDSSTVNAAQNGLRRYLPPRGQV